MVRDGNALPRIAVRGAKVCVVACSVDATLAYARFVLARPTQAGRVLGRWYDYAVAGRRRELVLAAGMPRSGSTWFYNATRLSLAESGKQTASGWIDDQLPLRRKSEPTLLLKIHDYDPVLTRVAQRVIYSYRDIRDVLASMNRIWGRPPTLEVARTLVRRDQHWRAMATFQARYEDMIADRLAVLTALRAHLGLPEEGAEECLAQLERLTAPPGTSDTPTMSYAPDTLLHPGHVTNGRAGAWQAEVDPVVITEIEREFGWWLEDNGYSVMA